MDAELERRKLLVEQGRLAGYAEGLRKAQVAQAEVFASGRRSGTFEVKFPDPNTTRQLVCDVPVPTPQYARLVSMGMRPLRFRAIEHIVEFREFGCESTGVRWFTWEPEQGSPEVEERTRVMFNSLGRLTYALQLMTVQWGRPLDVDVDRARVLVGDVLDEIRLRVGKYAPDFESHLPIRDRAYAYFAGRKL